MRDLPLAFPGMRIGLFGGSFDPAHEGHAHVAETALKRLQLDRIWWLVSPQNPLKPAASAPLAARLESARQWARGPSMVVTDLETRLGLRYTADTLAALRRRYPGVRFVWVMGADNLRSFHRWKRWEQMFRTTPIAAISRPGAGPKAAGGKAFRRFAQAHKDQGAAASLAAAIPPAWLELNAPLNAASSTALRARRTR